MAQVPDLSKLIDGRSEEIWNIINSKCDVTVAFHNHNYYLNYTLNEKFTLFVPRNNYDKDYFAHEILHIYLSTKGIKIGAYLFEKFRKDFIIMHVLTKDLLHHINNVIEHVKMLPLYLELGFKRNKFLLDYNDCVCNKDDIVKISELQHANSKNWKELVDLYLGKFFAIKSCPNLETNYAPQLSKLQSINTSLYDILDTFWTQWIDFDFEKYDTQNYSYREFCDDFYDSLLLWTLRNYR